MGTPGMVGPLTIPVWGQNVAVPLSYAFAPGNAVGPIPSGAGQAPLATLPPGASAAYAPGSGSPTGGSVPGLGGGFSLGGFSVKTLVILAAAFVLGLFVLDRVHWRG